MAPMLWRLVVKIFEPSVSEDFPVVTHIFSGRSAEEAERYLEAHMETDEFLRDCVTEGRFGDLECIAVRHRVPPVEGLDEPPVTGDLDSLEVDPLDLYIGTFRELERTDNLDEAREIALTHLLEDPCYYDKRVVEFPENLSVE